MHNTKWVVRVALLLIFSTASATAYMLLNYDDYRQDQTYRQIQYMNSR
jgi:hypothetical protein